MTLSRARPTHLVAALLAAVALVAAGCGDDEGRVSEQGATETSPGTATSPTTAPTETSPAPAATETEPDPSAPEEETTTGAGGGVSPEDQEGGAGDEIPARSVAMFRGDAGGISPDRVRVPPYIAVRVELRSVDGASYRLRAKGRTLTVGGRVSTMAATFDGLRPGRRLVLTGPSGRAVVEASAEPGP